MAVHAQRVDLEHAPTCLGVLVRLGVDQGRLVERGDRALLGDEVVDDPAAAQAAVVCLDLEVARLALGGVGRVGQRERVGLQRRDGRADVLGRQLVDGGGGHVEDGQAPDHAGVGA